MDRAILREGWMRAKERLLTKIFLGSEDISVAAAREVAALVRRRQAEGGQASCFQQAPRLRHTLSSPYCTCLRCLRRLPPLMLLLVARMPCTAGRSAVLGLATGSTPMQVYRELVRMHRQDWLQAACTAGLLLLHGC